MPDRPAHVRIPETLDIDVSKIRVDSGFQTNEQMVRLIVAAERGKIKCAYTRLQETVITSGFYRRSGSTSEHVTNGKPEYVDAVAASIRSGLRPVLGVYWSPLSDQVSKFVCPDDEVALAAYRKLQIPTVPCLIYRPTKVALPEAAVWCEKRGKHIHPAGSVPSSRVDAQMTFGLSDPPFDHLVGTLIGQCEKARSNVLQFHIAGAEKTHYHHVLHATMKRHERLLDSVQELVSKGRVEHAEGLVRIGYEAFLNFYLDWLSPAFFGPRFQLLSRVRHAELHEDDPRRRAELRSSLSVLQNFVSLLETTAEKARLSPLGSVVHARLYPPLSLVSHQAYGNVEAEAESFDDVPVPDCETRVRQLGRWLDAITTAMVVRIREDVGAAASVQP